MGGKLKLRGRFAASRPGTTSRSDSFSSSLWLRWQGRSDIVRTMFALYALLIVGGVIFFVTVGLTQQ